MSKVTTHAYQVVTGVPDPTSGNTQNLISPPELYLKAGTYPNHTVRNLNSPPYSLEHSEAFVKSLRVPAFEVGELLIVEASTQREVIAPYRRLETVDFTEFKDLSAALDLSLRLTEPNRTRPTPKPSFQVITAIPDPKEDDGNLASAFNLCLVDESAAGVKVETIPLIDALFLSLETPVFQVGQIIMVDSATDREIPWPGRKVTKWPGVQYSQYYSLDQAITQSQRLVPPAPLAKSL